MNFQLLKILKLSALTKTNRGDNFLKTYKSKLSTCVARVVKLNIKTREMNGQNIFRIVPNPKTIPRRLDLAAYENGLVQVCCKTSQALIRRVEKKTGREARSSPAFSDNRVHRIENERARIRSRNKNGAFVVRTFHVRVRGGWGSRSFPSRVISFFRKRWPLGTKRVRRREMRHLLT